MNEVIRTENLSKKFYIGTRERYTLFTTIRYKLSGETASRELWALKDINFSVKKGEMVAIIGPNAAGKTTLLKVLSGIMSPTSGTFEVKEEVSTIFELGLGFNPMSTALHNVYLYGALHGLSRRQIDKKLPQIIEFSELEDFMDAKLRDFSAGMRARLAFATIIQTVKGIIMVDETLSVGDAAFRKKCIGAFEKVLNEGNTVLFVSHGIGGEQKLCSRALYLDRGKQIGFGPVEKMIELYARSTERIKGGQR